MKSTKDWYNKSAVIFGQRKSGKTHLLNIWSVYNNALLINCLEIQNWNAVSIKNNIAIDDFHNLYDEEGFFHFYNNLIQDAIAAISQGTFKKWSTAFLKNYN